MSDTAPIPETPKPPVAETPKELSAAFKKLGIQPPKVREAKEKNGFMKSLRERAKKQDHQHVYMKPVKIEAPRRRN